jgi:hypothetical protein
MLGSAWLKHASHQADVRNREGFGFEWLIDRGWRAILLESSEREMRQEAALALARARAGLGVAREPEGKPTLQLDEARRGIGDRGDEPRRTLERERHQCGGLQLEWPGAGTRALDRLDDRRQLAWLGVADEQEGEVDLSGWRGRDDDGDCKINRCEAVKRIDDEIRRWIHGDEQAEEQGIRDRRNCERARSASEGGSLWTQVNSGSFVKPSLTLRALSISLDQ